MPAVAHTQLEVAFRIKGWADEVDDGHGAKHCVRHSSDGLVWLADREPRTLSRSGFKVVTQMGLDGLDHVAVQADPSADDVAGFQIPVTATDIRYHATGFFHQ